MHILPLKLRKSPSISLPTSTYFSWSGSHRDLQNKILPAWYCKLQASWLQKHICLHRWICLNCTLFKRPCLSSCYKAFEMGHVFFSVSILSPWAWIRTIEPSSLESLFQYQLLNCLRVGTDDFRLVTSIHQDSGCSVVCNYQKRSYQKRSYQILLFPRFIYSFEIS